jgi:hypothetical protein
MEGLIALKVKRGFQAVKILVPEKQIPAFAYVIWLGENINTLRNNVRILLLIIITGSSGENKKVYFPIEPTSSPT